MGVPTTAYNRDPDTRRPVSIGTSATRSWTTAPRRATPTTTRLAPASGPSGRLLRRNDEQASVSYLDLPGRFRRRPEPERGEPTRRGRRAAPRLGDSAGRLAPSPRPPGRRRQRERTDSRGITREHRRWADGPEHVRPCRRRPLARRGVDGLVGRRPSLPLPRV